MVRPSLPRKCKTVESSAPAPGGIQKGPAKPKAVAKPKAKGQRQPAAAAPAAPDPDAWTQYGDSDGSAVLQCWDDLARAIRDYVNIHCFTQFDWNMLQPSTRQKFSRVSRRAKQYYASNERARTLFEALMWRCLVDLMFKPYTVEGVENIELWPGYTALLLKLDDQLASRPPRLLKSSQDPASILAWNKDQNQLDPNQANLNQAGQGPANQVPVASQPVPPAPGWEDQGAHHIKQLYYNWRPRTAEMMQLASGHTNRFHSRDVEDRVGWALPDNFVHITPGREARHTWMLKTIADVALRADRLMQLSSLRWEFRFEDPNGPGTGPTSGFGFDDSQGLMILHGLQWDQHPRAQSRSVDHVIRPLLRCYTLDPDAQRWDTLLHMRPMQVCMYGKGRKVPVAVPAPAAGGNQGDAGNAGNAGNP